MNINKNGHMIQAMSNDGYCAMIDQVGKSEWNEVLQHFDDASIYQTWSYGSVRWGKNNLSHLVLKKNGSAVAAAQLRIMKLPVIERGIAYIRWGPMWQLDGDKENAENLRQMILALRREYVLRRGLFLRILPNEFEHNKNIVHSVFQDEGFHWKEKSYRTFLLNLRPSMDHLRRNLTQRWRRQLNIAGKKDLKLIEGKGDELFGAFMSLYNDMLKRKQFQPGLEIKDFRAIQKDLPENLKMRIILCEFNKKVVSGLIFSVIGNTGIYLLGATGTDGLKTRGSYLLYWRMIEYLKEKNCLYLDLGGINPDKNPGVYTFKAGLSGEDVVHIGQYELSNSTATSLLIRSGEMLQSASRKITAT